MNLFFSTEMPAVSMTFSNPNKFQKSEYTTEVQHCSGL